MESLERNDRFRTVFVRVREGKGIVAIGFPKVVGPEPSGRGSASLFDSVEQLEQHMARELHDQVAQPLVSLLLEVFQLRRRQISSEAMTAELATVEESVRRVLRQSREMLLDLRGQGDIRLNFIQVVRNELTHAGVGRSPYTTSLTVSPLWPRHINGWAAFNLLRIVQEAISNAARHGHASKIEIVFDIPSQDDAAVQVLDNGWGIDGAPSGFGMEGMRERALILGGTFNATSRQGGGACVEVRLPSRNLE